MYFSFFFLTDPQIFFCDPTKYLSHAPLHIFFHPPAAHVTCWDIKWNSPKKHMMSVVGKSTCSEIETVLFLSYHGRNAVRYIKQRGYFMEDGRISGYLDTKYMIILWIEEILHNFEDQNLPIFFNLEQVKFRIMIAFSFPFHIHPRHRPNIFFLRPHPHIYFFGVVLSQHTSKRDGH